MSDEPVIIHQHQLDGPPPVCPDCRAVLDGATSASGTGRAPGPGDVTICSYCAAVLVFTDEMALRPATSEELVELSSHPLWPVMRATAHALVAKQPRTGIQRLPLDGPHSRACGMFEHPHGIACHGTCPTCHGVQP